MKSQVTKARFCDLIDELADDHCRCKYCFLKMFVESVNPSVDVLSQLKCIEKYKWEESERQGKDIGWNEAMLKWVDNGYAKIFRDLYSQEISINELYKSIMTKNEK